MPPRQTKCKICRTLFAKRSITHKVCGPDCAIELATQDRQKREKKAHREQKVKQRTRRDWLKLAQSAVNLYVRKRDEALPCISCGRHHNGQYHAGHYMSVGARPELRFDLANINKQCAPCNDHLSGNIALYRINLIRKIGQAEVDRLEGPVPPQKWTIEELIEIRKTYTAKAKDCHKDIHETGEF